jgi:sulfoxide reductase heme-binding subunit YedZ
VRSRHVRWLQATTHLGALMPLAVLVWMFWERQLGPDPIGETIRRTGRYALVFLILSLVPTAVRTITGYGGLLRVRRALGLYAFLYAALHALAFAGLDYGFEFGLILQAIGEGRREIVGLAALAILTALALTSIPGLMRCLGRYWKPLHRLVYLAGGLVVLHYVWNYKEFRAGPTLAGMALVLLLAARLPTSFFGKLSRSRLD